MEEGNANFSVKNWEDWKDKDMDILVCQERKKELLDEIGYSVDQRGFLRDKESNKKIKAEDGKEINLNKDRKIALIQGSHTFVRNIAVTIKSNSTLFD